MGEHRDFGDETFPCGGVHRLRHEHGFRGPFGPHGRGGHWGGGPRARRGDVRQAILSLLQEGPMHGYQIIQELSARTGGAWNPSPGSVYPTLQLLEDEGLVASEEAGGKRVYSLTEDGRAKAAENLDKAPWEGFEGLAGAMEARAAVGKLIAAFWQVTQSGSQEQRARALEIVNEARKKLYGILSED